MSFAFPMFLLVVAGQQNSMLPLTKSQPGMQQNQFHSECHIEPATGTDAESKVKDVVRRFNSAVLCKDRVTAMRFVAEDGTISEIEEYVGDDGKSVRWVGTGSWAEQLFLFTRPDSDTMSDAGNDSGERVIQGEPEVIIDGSAALVRQPLWTESAGNPPISGCLIEHFMLIEDAQGWKIRHMMLVPDAAGCLGR